MSISNLKNTDQLDSRLIACTITGVWNGVANLEFQKINDLVFVSVPEFTNNVIANNPQIIYTFNSPLPSKFHPNISSGIKSFVVTLSQNTGSGIAFVNAIAYLESDNTKITVVRAGGGNFTAGWVVGFTGQTMVYSTLTPNNN